MVKESLEYKVMKYIGLLMVIAIFIILFILVAEKVKGQLTDKEILRGNNCFNISFNVEKSYGNFTKDYLIILNNSRSFGSCNRNINNWTCNCLGDSNFSIILRSDNLSSRIFNIKVNFTNYQLFNEQYKMFVLDDGNVSISTKNLVSKDYCNNKVIYENITIYKDKIVPEIQYVDKPIYIERNITQYIENNTRIEELDRNNKIRYYGIVMIAMIILIIMLLIFLKRLK